MRPTKQKKQRRAIKQIGNNLLFYMEKKEITQMELADLCDTNRQHINKIIHSGKNHISLLMAFKISRALKQPVEKLFFIE